MAPTTEAPTVAAPAGAAPAVDADASKKPSYVHDIWGVGVVTSAFADGYRGIITSYPTEEEIKDTFKKHSQKSTGISVDRLAGALRDLAKSERQVQRLVDSVRRENFPLDEEGFTELVKPSGAPYYVPYLGHTLSFFGRLVAEPMDGYSRTAYQSNVPREPQVETIFQGADLNKDGKLDGNELSLVLRRRGYTEKFIDEAVASEAVQKGGMSLYEFKKLIRGAKYSEATMNWVPYVGPRAHSYLIGDDEIPEADIKAAWDHVAQGKKTLEKEGVEQVLQELGKGSYESSRLLASPTGEEDPAKKWSFDELKIILLGEPPKEASAETAEEAPSMASRLTFGLSGKVFGANKKEEGDKAAS